MQIRASLPPDHESQQEAINLIAKYETLQAAVDAANLPFTKATLSDIAAGKWHNLGTDTMNQFRASLNMEPLPEAKFVIKRKKTQKKRKAPPRYHPPQDPVKLAEYLTKRMSDEQWETMIQARNQLQETEK